MAITTQLVGTLGGSKGYYIANNSVKTYQLPPNSNGWSLLFARYSGTTNISYKITNRTTGEVVYEYNTSNAFSGYISGPGIYLQAAKDGMNLIIRNSADLRICIASGVSNVPPTA